MIVFAGHPKILHKHCFQFHTKNNTYAKFWGDKKRALWYVMVFSGVVNSVVTN